MTVAALALSSLAAFVRPLPLSQAAFGATVRFQRDASMVLADGCTGSATNARTKPPYRVAASWSSVRALASNARGR
jgi:hypothetical protein